MNRFLPHVLFLFFTTGVALRIQFALILAVPLTTTWVFLWVGLANVIRKKK